MITFANCKINIGLQVTGKREDGFHNIMSLFYPVGLCDVVEAVVNRTGKFGLETWGIEIPGSKEENIIYRAYDLLKRDYSLPGFDFFLGKKIPPGSGLGGGSSDGIKALYLIGSLCDLKMKEDDLMRYATMLGSDCSFFIGNKPQFMSGRGELMQPAEINLGGMYICIIKPGFGISTKEAYGMIIPDNSRTPVHELLRNPLDQWKNLIFNDFEPPIISRFPFMGEIKAILYDSGAVYASMSGSGSAIYGLFNREVGLQHLFKNYFYWEGKL